MFELFLSDSGFTPEPLQISLLDQFNADGLIHLTGVFSRDEIDFISDITRVVSDSGNAPSEHLADGFRSWRALTTVSRELAGLACDPRLVRIGAQLLGSSLRLVGTQLIHRHPHHGPRSIRTPERPGWHRDIYGMSNDLGQLAPPCAIKCTVWLSDASTLDHGATRFLPGSHRNGLPLVPPGEIDPPGWASPVAAAGDVTVFENRTAHAGGLNTSESTCEMLIIQYGYRWLAPVVNRPHPPSILDRCSPLAKQLLEPDECDEEGCYCPGLGRAIIEDWAAQRGLGPYLKHLPATCP